VIAMHLSQLLVPDLPKYPKEESEFYKREFGLSCDRIKSGTTEPLPPGSLLYCVEIDDWKSRLLATPPKSVVILQSGNEYYDTKKWEKLNQYKSIRAACIEYYPAKFRIKQCPLALIWPIQNPKELLTRTFWGETKRAFSNQLKLQSMKLDFPVVAIPIGYTNRFVEELKLLKYLGSEEGSLFDLVINNHSVCRNGIGFCGQKGSYARRKMINYFSRTSETNIHLHDSYAGNLDETKSTIYVQTIRNSRFGLCPPGNRSNCTHRYIELLVLNAIPIATEITVQDWTIHNLYPPELQKFNMSYKKLWKFLSEKSESELLVLLEVLKSHSRDAINNTRRQIEVWREECMTVNED